MLYRNRFVGVWEDSTCHYHVKVELAFFCAFTEFVPHKENVSALSRAALVLHYVEALTNPCRVHVNRADHHS